MPETRYDVYYHQSHCGYELAFAGFVSRRKSRELVLPYLRLAAKHARWAHEERQLAAHETECHQQRHDQLIAAHAACDEEPDFAWLEAA